jgi:hypothetical protein
MKKLGGLEMENTELKGKLTEMQTEIKEKENSQIQMMIIQEKRNQVEPQVRMKVIMKRK